MSTLVKKYPALSILILSQLIALPLIGLIMAGVLPTGLFLIAALSGSLAGIILAAIEGGKKSLRELLGRVLIWRVGILHWAVALGVPFVIYLLTLYLYGLFSGTPMNLSGLDPLYTIVPLLLFLSVQAGLGEEIGWRGYLLPRLQARYTALVSTIIVTVSWLLWHWSLFFIDGMFQSEMRLFYGFIPAFLMYGVSLFSMSTIMTWQVNNAKGTALMAIIFHGAINTAAGYLGFESIAVKAGPYLVAIELVIALILIFVAGPKHLSRKHERNVVELGSV